MRPGSEAEMLAKHLRVRLIGLAMAALLGSLPSIALAR